MDYETYRARIDAIEDTSRTLNDLATKSRFDPQQLQILKESLSLYETETEKEYVHDRLYTVASHFAPKHKWDAPESEKPLRLFALRFFHRGFDTFWYERSFMAQGYEVHVSYWLRDSEEHAEFHVPQEWMDLPWTELVPILDAHMQDGWDAEAERGRKLAVQNARRELARAQEALAKLGAGANDLDFVDEDDDE